jgi:ribulose-5-phosphate 4-epimerase/fuculose-1-phosphate aldolase
VQSIVHVHARFVVVMSVLEVPLVPMCQEGIQLVTKPLPVYPHVKTIQTDEEGEEVAALLGDNKAMILQGHGSITVGESLDESVLASLQLEEQARMNWYACCAAGLDHKRIPDERIAEMSGRTPLRELPHFAEPMRNATPRMGGVYAHYSELVGRDI